MKGHVNGRAEGEKRVINAELWYACAGPLVSLPPVGSLVVYFPQGHSEQVAASIEKDVNAHIPNYPNLPSKLICLLHNVTLHVDPETDEVYAQMTLQPVNTYNKEALQLSQLATKQVRPPTDFFCKTLTASDTSTHGGFSVPRRSAEKIFPLLDFTMQPPAQELQARDLHDTLWTFRHVYRGQPKRHLLTTGWSLFISGKRLSAGDSVLFIRDEKQQLLLGIRRANRQSTNISSSVLSSDSMHIGILAAAAHAASNNSPFNVFYNPRASPSEFVVPFVKYQKAVYSSQISLGMRFRMIFETEESGTRRYMGTITGTSDIDPVRWKNSQWRNLQVGWDESAAGERRNRVSLWEIEPVAAPFFTCPPPPFLGKRPWQPGIPDDDSMEMETLSKRMMPWLGEETCMKDLQTQGSAIPGLNLIPWMNLQQNPNIQAEYTRALAGPGLQNLSVAEISRQLSSQSQLLQQNNIQLSPNLLQQHQQLEQLSKAPIQIHNLAAVAKQQQNAQELAELQRQQLVSQIIPLNQMQNNITPPQLLFQAQMQQQQIIQNNQPLLTSVQQKLPQLSQHLLSLQRQQQQQQQQQSQQHLQQEQQQLQQQHRQQENRIASLPPNQLNQQLQLSDYHLQIQLLQKIQQESLLLQSSMQQPQLPLIQQNQETVPDIPQSMSNSYSLAQHLIPQLYANAPTQTSSLPETVQNKAPQKLQEQLLANEIGSTLPVALKVSAMPQTGGSVIASAGTYSSLTDEMPSCSTSPSTNNSIILPQSILKSEQHNVASMEKILQPAVTMVSAQSLREASGNHSSSEHQQRSIASSKHCIPNTKVSPGVPTPQIYSSNNVQTDYLDITSSATSVCLFKNDVPLQQSVNFSSFIQPQFLRDVPQDSDVEATDPRNNVLFGVTIDGPLSVPSATDRFMANSLGSEKYTDHIPNVFPDYSNTKEVHPELSTSMVSQSFDVAGIAFDSFDPTTNENSLLNRNSWAPAPPLQRMRTYTKVYKRGAVGRSIDISRYSGYDELKRDLARMFSIEGQLEDRQRVGWKLVYVDHEKDVLLVGDDPWEEFVSCASCIRILSPQEVQQMSLDGDLENNIDNNMLSNQACSSSDGGDAWRRQCDLITSNPSAGSYDHFE